MPSWHCFYSYFYLVLNDVTRIFKRIFVVILIETKEGPGYVQLVTVKGSYPAFMGCNLYSKIL